MTRRLFLHCCPDLPSCPERALVMAAPGDLVCVSGPVDSDYLELLNELGVGPLPGGVVEHPLSHRPLADEALLERIAGALGPGDALELHVCAATADVYALADALEDIGAGRVRVLAGDPAAARLAEQKHVVRGTALELGVPVAPGEVVELPFAGGRRRGDFDRLRSAIQRQLGWTGRVIVRGSVGTAGSPAFLVGRGGDDADGLIRRLGVRPDNRVYLVEALVDATVSPRLHCRIHGDGTVAVLGATDQRWGRPLVHAGDAFPSAARTLGAMEVWARTLAGWLADRGYAGEAGFDFIEYRDGGGARGVPRAFFTGLKPRVGDAAYPLALRHGLNQARRAAGLPALEAFATGTLATGAESFGELREALGHLVFTHERGAGVVPYAIGTLGKGRCAAVALGASRQEALELYAEARAALDADWAER